MSNGWSAGEAHVDDVGVDVVLTFVGADDGSVIDLSGTSEKEVILRKPDDTVLTKTASFVTDGADGKIVYSTEADVLDVAGTWEVQGRVAWAVGTDLHSSVHEFVVKENLT